MSKTLAKTELKCGNHDYVSNQMDSSSSEFEMAQSACKTEEILRKGSFTFCVPHP